MRARNRGNIFETAIIVFVWLLPVGCQSVEVSKEFPHINKVAKNSEFVIKLPEDHRTGYNWQLVQNYDKAVIQLVNEVWHGNEKGIYFHLKSLSSGQTELNFVKRKFVDTSDIKVFTVKIADP